tara:strand:+ start:36060 stop:37016 length:957 start_codon:yes stop_codon:yes gene_type:complete
MNDRNDHPRNKKEALEFIAALTRNFKLTPSEISEAIINDQIPSTEDNTQSSLIAKLFSYLGGVFILGGIAAFISLYWDNFNSFSRVSFLLVPGFVFYLIAVLLNENPYFKKITTPLYVLSYILELSGLYVFLYEYFEHTGSWDKPTLFVFGVLLLQQSLTFLSKQNAAVLFCTMLSSVGVLIAFFDMIGFDESYSISVIGIVLLGCTYFVQKTQYKNLTGFWYFVAGFMCLGGIFSILEKTDLDIFILLPTCFLVYMSTFVKSKSLLFVSIVSLFAFLGYFTTEYFSDSLGWPVLLIILGIVLFALSLMGVKISKRFG